MLGSQRAAALIHAETTRAAMRRQKTDPGRRDRGTNLMRAGKAA
jgi:hypothetical protein